MRSTPSSVHRSRRLTVTESSPELTWTFHAARDDRPGQDGRQHDRAADARRARGRRLRPRSGHACRSTSRSARAPAKDLADVVAPARSRRASSGSWCPPASRSTTRSTRCSPQLAPGDIIIDGGNSNVQGLACARAERLAAKRDQFIDAGTSGGIWGLENGYCLMVGGEHDGGEALRADLPRARAGGRLRARRPAGRGALREDGAQRHRVRRCCRRYAEGYEILAASKKFPELDLHQIAELWQHGSVVRSWLNELAVDRVREGPAAASSSRATSPTPARGAGRCRRRSTRTCRRR